MDMKFFSRSAARNTFYLKKVGVSHVLNTAEGQTSGTVDTNQASRESDVINSKLINNPL